ncbi:ArsR family transcriptional regulator [Thermotoga sp. Ku-13t]|uniref:ROK family transcriptional regulator n=1 Tax=Thermotoga sp. Ku-13t TaxID=1755813 RepID=UPI0013E9D0FE|nr:ROK family transcriptional regulator [Thermotoga sp. Ku-13t]KAF2958384.1 ArsR family transcriptional regulator [Thermotoga sp. Ku-13t]
MPAPALRRENKLRVLKCLFEHGPMSRAQLSKLTELSLSTLSYIVRELSIEGLIDVDETEPSRGRPSQLLSIDPNAWYVIGVKMGREEVRGVLFDAKMRPVKKRSVRILSHMRNNEGYTFALLNVVETLKTEKLLGIGVCSSGIVSEEKVVVSHLMNVRQLDVQKILGQNLGINHVLLMNDVDALAYSLSNHRREEFLVISYGTGIGASFWSGGHARHFEIGHSIVASDGRCYCGQTGCLEYHSSEYAVLKWYLRKDIDFEDFVMNEEEKYRSVVEEIRSCARSNFDSVKTYYFEPFRRFSLVLGNLIMVLKPRNVFFLGEGIVNDDMVQMLQTLVRERFNSEFIGDATFQRAVAEWEEGVAFAAVRRFLPKLLFSPPR